MITEARPTVQKVHQEAVAARPGLRSRRLEPAGHPPVHVLEQPGPGMPLVLLHGGGSSATYYLPLLDELGDRHVVAVDRPGFGLSAPVAYEPDSFRRTAVEFVRGVLDVLEVDRADVVGNSMGGTWALWYALEEPARLRRLALLGAPPLVPGTRIPAALRFMAAPGVGELVSRVMTPSPRMVEQIMASFGEEETVGDHPEVVAGAIAGAADPVASRSQLAETRAVMTTLGGFRDELRLSRAELAAVEVPALLVWGQDDPVGGAAVGRTLADTLATATLELLPCGHIPWFGHPRRVADHLERFLEAAS